MQLGALISYLHFAVATASPLASTTYDVTDIAYRSSAGDVNVKVLTNRLTGEHAKILWDWGGKIEQLALRGSSGTVRDVLATRCGDSEDCTVDMLKADGLTSLNAMLVPFANRVAHGTYIWGGKEEHLTTDSTGNAMHGFLINGKPMVVLSQHASSTNATLVLGVTFDGSDPGYPFVVSVNISYVLGATGLTLTLRARNEMDHSPAPFMAGCHPYFKLLHSDFASAKLELDECTGWNRQLQSALQVPSGVTRRFTGFEGDASLAGPREGCPACGSPAHWDDAFTALAHAADCPKLVAKVHDGDDTMRLELRDGFRYLQVFTGFPGIGLAVEPMSSATNSWNNMDGVVVLEAGRVWQGEFHIGMEFVGDIPAEALATSASTDRVAGPSVYVGLRAGFVVCLVGMIFATLIFGAYSKFWKVGNCHTPLLD